MPAREFLIWWFGKDRQTRRYITHAKDFAEAAENAARTLNRLYPAGFTIWQITDQGLASQLSSRSGRG